MADPKTRLISLLAASLLISQPLLAADNMQGNSTGWVAADDLGNNIKIPRVKMTFGVDGVAQDVDASHPMPITGSLSATLSGFTPGGTVANLAVTTSSANVALPAGVVVAVTNDGAADVSYKLSVGTSTAATTDHILKSGATVGLTVGANTYINAITASGSSHLSMAGGAGLVTGYGGGGSGGSGGAVTNAGTFAVQLTGATNNINNISGTVSLPTGAATAAKQPALGTAGSPSSDVITVQGSGSGTAMPVSIASVPSHAVTNAGTFATQAAQSGTWTVQPGNTANTTAWKVDGSAVTQPVSVASIPSHAVTNAGTFAVQNNAATPAGTNVIGKVSAVDSGGTDATDTTNHAIKVNVVAGGAGGGAVYGPTAVGSAAANPPVLMAGTANAGATGNVQVMKIDSSGNAYVKGVGVAANDATSGVTYSPISVNAATACNAKSFTNAQQNSFDMDLKGNVCANVASLGGTAIDTNSGNKSAGTQRIVLATDQVAIPTAGQGATGSAVPAGATYVGANSGGNLTGLIQADSSAKIDISTATTTQLVALSSGKKIYVTNYKVIAGGTGNFKFVYGTGSNCGTGTTDLEGANNLTAQSGSTDGGGLGPVLIVPASNALCATTSAAVQMSGHLAYTQF